MSSRYTILSELIAPCNSLFNEIKEFLARNGISYQWLDIEGDEEARRLVSFANSNRSDTNFNSSTIITNFNKEIG